MEEIRSGSRGRSRSPRRPEPAQRPQPLAAKREPQPAARPEPAAGPLAEPEPRPVAAARPQPQPAARRPRAAVAREPRGEGEDAERKPRVPPEEEVGRQVYVGNLNFNTDKKMMEDAVGEYGKIRDIYMPADNDGRPRGFCFVTFEEKTQAEACALGMNGRELDGRVVRCNIARPRPTPDERRRRRTTTTVRAAAGRGRAHLRGRAPTSRSATTTSSTGTAASTS